MYWDYKNFDQDIFSQEICTGLSSETVLDFTRFEENFLGVWNKHAPMKKKVLRAKHASYVTKALRKAIMKRSYLEKLYLKKRQLNLWKSIRNIIFVVDYIRTQKIFWYIKCQQN